MLDLKALFHDMTAQFLNPAECEPGDIVTVRFRTGRDQAEGVELIMDTKTVAMKEVWSEQDYNDYEASMQMQDSMDSYCFRIRAAERSVVYDRRGGTAKKLASDKMMFHLIPGFHTPEWAKGAVMYQIFTDRFYNGDRSNDVLTNEYHYMGKNVRFVDNWNRVPFSKWDGCEFYGGDLQGVLDKMDYLQTLGIEVIYFNPLFCSPSSHKYDIQDYDHIDPHFGKIVSDKGALLSETARSNRHAQRYINRVTNEENLQASDELFRQVVGEAHRRGIRVILDGVFNHCGSFNKWLDRERIYENVPGYSTGAYISADSPYHNYFSFHGKKWPNNKNYDGWWNYDTLPKLNYEASEELCEYVLGIGRKWVSAPFYVDGWRLDVAADLGHSSIFNHTFWKRFRKAVKQANPEAIILAEHYGSARNWLQGDEWDTVMNYDAFMEPLTYFLTGMEKHSDAYHSEMEGDAKAFWKQMTHYIAENFTEASFHTAMNELSNHDHSRFLTRTNHIVGRCEKKGNLAADQNVRKYIMREAVVVQMTWPGAPTIYYGDEAGLSGFTDPDNRRTYPWGQEDQEMIAFHRDAILMHKQNEELRTGSLCAIAVQHEKNVLAYGRFNADAACVVVLNNSMEEVTEQLDVHYLGIRRDCMLRQLLRTTETGYETTAIQMTVTNGRLTLTIPAYAAVVLKYVKREAEGPEYIKYHFAEFR